MILEIDTGSRTPIYLQIYYSIVSAIAKGDLKDSEQLPSARKLAKDLGINYHTVNKAYNLLEMEGFVIVRRKKTVVVANRDPEAMAEFVEKWKMVVAEMTREAIAKGVPKEMMREMYGEIIDELFEERSE